ncbi:ATP-binding protein, partial [Sphingobium yanoikuyae]|uniref:ATP-binding protein n=1 Tax=Sphingobium yanoikuyae TaxID=13690 RepID=UPI0031D0E544
MADGDRQLLGERRSFGPFALLPAERLLTRDGVPVEIGGRSFDLLVVLTEQPGQILSKRDLLKRVWPDVVVEDGSLRFHMAGLRKLLGEGTDGARYIATQVGVGYAFVAPVAVQGPETGQTVTTAPAPLAPTHNIPPRLPHLIGRTEDLALLQDRVMDTPLFTIVGAGGVGKTSLAIEIGHALAPQFANRVAFVDFSMLENPGLVRPMIAGAMGLTVQSDDPLAVILGHLRDQSFLLLLDNCEHLIAPTAELVEHIIDAAPQVRILATSREPLRVRGEHVHRLDALGYPDDREALTLAQLRAYPAIELFLERARAADSQFRVDEGDARLIGDLCARLGGMALPIELAAVRAATHGLEATARQLGERFSLMWPGRRTALPRQQTLQATLDWSHDLLPDVERIVLERLAIFVGPFSIDAALAVVADALVGADDIAAAVDQLVAKSLIAPNRMRGTGTYRLLEITRAHGRQHLLARGQSDFHANARRHAAYYLAELEALLAQEDDVLQDQRPLRQQLGNIRSALDWAFGEDGDRRIAVRLAAASAPVFLNLSHLIECRNWCQRRSKSRPFGGVKPGHRVTCRGEWREGVARGPLPRHCVIFR